MGTTGLFFGQANWLFVYKHCSQKIIQVIHCLLCCHLENKRACFASTPVANNTAEYKEQNKMGFLYCLLSPISTVAIDMEYTKAFTAFARPGDSTGLEYWSTPDIHSLPLPYKTAVTAKLSRQAIADYTRTLVVLGTHRVPTIDTTLNTYQPMEYKKSSAIVLSGDVYNYKELGDSTDPVNDTVSLVKYLANANNKNLPDILCRIRGEFSFVYVTGLDSFERKPTVLAVRDTIGTRPLYVRGMWSVTEIPAGHYYFNGVISKYTNNCDAKHTTVPWSNTEQLYTAIANLLETQVTRVYSHFAVPVGILVSGFCSLTIACLLAKNGHAVTAFTLSTNNEIKIPNVPNIDHVVVHSDKWETLWDCASKNTSTKVFLSGTGLSSLFAGTPVPTLAFQQFQECGVRFPYCDPVISEFFNTVPASLKRPTVFQSGGPALDMYIIRQAMVYCGAMDASTAQQ